MIEGGEEFTLGDCGEMKAVISGLLSHYGMDSPSSQGSPGYYSGTDSFPEVESVAQDVQYPQGYHYNNGYNDIEYNQTPYNYSSDDWRYYNNNSAYYSGYSETNYPYSQDQYQHQAYEPSVNGNAYAVNGYCAVDCVYDTATQNCYIPSSHPSFTSEENSLEGCHWDGVS